MLSVLSGCSDDAPPEAQSSAPPARDVAAQAQRTRGESREAAKPVTRWYTAEQVSRGAPVFAEHCASCHGDGAQGTFTWRKKGPDGKFPPPPLNGTAHAWHHPFKALAFQIKFSTPGGQGSMPPFEGTLTDREIVDVIAWIQSRWPDDVYASWSEIDARARRAGR